MKCTNCGTEFEEGLFCPECGTKNDAGDITEDKLKQEKTEKTKTGIVALISGILGFLTSIFVIGIVFDVIALITARKAKKKGVSKTIANIALILGVLGVAIFGVCLVYTILPDETESVIEQKGELVDTTVYFDIKNMIDTGKLDEAYKKIEANYGNIKYDETEGFNKSSIYYMYYKATGEYDKLATVIYDCLAANVSKANKITDENVKKYFVINVKAEKYRFEEIYDSISPENKEKIENILKEYPDSFFSE